MTTPYLLKVLSDTLEDSYCFLDHLSAAEYTQPIPSLSGATIGQHTRHMIEFLDCLNRQASLGILNYDLRLRCEAWQTDPHAAKEVVRGLLVSLRTLKPNPDLRLRVAYGLEEDTPELELETTFARELVYNIEHIIHHLALIRVGLREIAPDLPLSPGFGWAPSTIRSRQS